MTAQDGCCRAVPVVPSLPLAWCRRALTWMVVLVAVACQNPGAGESGAAFEQWAEESALSVCPVGAVACGTGLPSGDLVVEQNLQSAPESVQEFAQLLEVNSDGFPALVTVTARAEADADPAARLVLEIRTVTAGVIPPDESAATTYARGSIPVGSIPTTAAAELTIPLLPMGSARKVMPGSQYALVGRIDQVSPGGVATVRVITVGSTSFAGGDLQSRTRTRQAGGVYSQVPFAALSVAADLSFGLVVESVAAPSCQDGLATAGSEPAPDCGGICPQKCAPGKACTSGSDCASGSCASGKCGPLPCGNGKRDPGESDVDCGGICAPNKCGLGKLCMADSECGGGTTQLVCDNPFPGFPGRCRIAVCRNGTKEVNAGESDVDCGGTSCAPCGADKTCSTNFDCESASCVSGRCAAPVCAGGKKTGYESDIDCGGPRCAAVGKACTLGRKCVSNSDCASGRCNNGTCGLSLCEDRKLSPGETDVDCGGVCSFMKKRCLVNKACKTSGDCDSTKGLACRVDAVTGLGKCLPSSCSNGAKDGKETDVDCGGVACGPCPDNRACAIAKDCQSNSCRKASPKDAAGLCQTLCHDKVLNGGESDVDCGASCAASPQSLAGRCANAKPARRCKRPLDCQSGLCSRNGLCIDTCFNGKKDVFEGGTDCGGPCKKLCAANVTCTRNADCVSNLCTTDASGLSVCAEATCSDGVKNGKESDVDCGVACGRPCQVGQVCAGASDCAAGFACGKDGRCKVSTCADTLRGASETDVDCGGVCVSGTKGRCALTKGCRMDGDCTTGNICLGGSATALGACRPASCAGVCGTVTCGPCGVGGTCTANTQCTSGKCEGGTCAAPTYADGVKNGLETDVDCGGNSSNKCAEKKSCVESSDCQSSVCSAKRCVAPKCTDGVQNGSETALDCGGTCGACPVGRSCSADTQCASGQCADGVCVDFSCNDSRRGGTETDVDCGGDCAAEVAGSLTCDVSRRCRLDTDCVSNARCEGFICVCPPGVTCGDAAAEEPQTSECAGGCMSPPNGCYEPQGRCLSGACEYTPRAAGSSCSDDSVCTVDELCVGLSAPDGTSSMVCSATTTIPGCSDTCTIGAGTYSKDTLESDTSETGSPCLVCDPAASTTAWTQLSGASCGSVVYGDWSECQPLVATDACALTGQRSRTVSTPTCLAGSCQTSTITETAVCDLGNTDGRACGTGSVAPGGCVPVNPDDTCGVTGFKTEVVSKSVCSAGACVPQKEERKTAETCALASPAGKTCFDPTGCFSSPTCQSASDGAFVCASSTSKCTTTTCTIGGQSYSAMATNPANPCQFCNPANPTVWSDRALNTSCEDSDPATATGFCSAGMCKTPPPIVCNAGCGVSGRAVNGHCVYDGPKAARTVCRPKAGNCDVDEFCDGVSVDCPPDRLVSSGTVCQPGSACTQSSVCSGASPDCQPGAALADNAACDGGDGFCQQGACVAGCVADGATYAPGEKITLADGSEMYCGRSEEGSGLMVNVDIDAWRLVTPDQLDAVPGPAWLGIEQGAGEEMQFRLYNSATGGSPVWEGEDCPITFTEHRGLPGQPDARRWILGRVQLGAGCGDPLPVEWLLSTTPPRLFLDVVAPTEQQFTRVPVAWINEPLVAQPTAADALDINGDGVIQPGFDEEAIQGRIKAQVTLAGSTARVGDRVEDIYDWADADEVLGPDECYTWTGTRLNIGDQDAATCSQCVAIPQTEQQPFVLVRGKARVAYTTRVVESESLNPVFNVMLLPVSTSGQVGSTPVWSASGCRGVVSRGGDFRLELGRAGCGAPVPQTLYSGTNRLVARISLNGQTSTPFDVRVRSGSSVGTLSAPLDTSRTIHLQNLRARVKANRDGRARLQTSASCSTPPPAPDRSIYCMEGSTPFWPGDLSRQDRCKVCKQEPVSTSAVSDLRYRGKLTRNGSLVPNGALKVRVEVFNGSSHFDSHLCEVKVVDGRFDFRYRADCGFEPAWITNAVTATNWKTALRIVHGTKEPKRSNLLPRGGQNQTGSLDGWPSGSTDPVASGAEGFKFDELFVEPMLQSTARWTEVPGCRASQVSCRLEGQAYRQGGVDADLGVECAPADPAVAAQYPSGNVLLHVAGLASKSTGGGAFNPIPNFATEVQVRIHDVTVATSVQVWPPSGGTAPKCPVQTDMNGWYSLTLGDGRCGGYIPRELLSPARRYVATFTLWTSGSPIVLSDNSSARPGVPVSWDMGNNAVTTMYAFVSSSELLAVDGKVSVIGHSEPGSIWRPASSTVSGPGCVAADGTQVPVGGRRIMGNGCVRCDPTWGRQAIVVEGILQGAMRSATSPNTMQSMDMSNKTFTASFVVRRANGAGLVIWESPPTGTPNQCSITTDANGKWSVDLGRRCGGALPPSAFAEAVSVEVVFPWMNLLPGVSVLNARPLSTITGVEIAGSKDGRTMRSLNTVSFKDATPLLATQPGGWVPETNTALCTTNTQCPTGMSWNGSTCIGNTASCGSGHYWNGTSCLPNTSTNCTNGYYWSGTSCLPIGTTQCGSGYYWNGTSCVSGTGGTCTAGFRWDGIRCVPDMLCPSSTYWDGYTCASSSSCSTTTNCPCGQLYMWNGGACVPGTSVNCGTGYSWNGTSCVPITTSSMCVPGYNWNGMSCVAFAASSCGSGTFWDGKTCQSGSGGQCLMGFQWDGMRCTPIPPGSCLTGSYWNGASCVPSNSTATMCVGGYNWTGTSCAPIPVGSCSAGMFWNGAGCQTGTGGTCSIGFQWTGSSCVTLAPTSCAPGSYWNGSACMPYPTSSSCGSGYVWNGTSCVPSSTSSQCGVGYSWNGSSCVDVDECTQNPCAPGQVCKNSPGAFVCESNGIVDASGCIPGYFKPYAGAACTDVNECSMTSSPAIQLCGSRTCENIGGGFICRL